MTDMYEGGSTLLYLELKLRREKQISKGYGPAHDDRHGWEEIAAASAAYTTNRRDLWPWRDGFNPCDFARERLVDAAALLIAAIESHDRTERNNEDAG